jgi:hypothetical protein
MRIKWTPEEIELVRENYRKPIREIQKLLSHRTYYSIAHLRRKYRFVIRDKQRLWSEEELKILREKYAETPIRELMETLKRSEYSIIKKASELDLRRAPYVVHPPTVREMNENERYYIACAIDGEGTLTIKHSRQYLCAEISTSNTCYEFLQRCKEYIGGKVSVRKHQRTKKWKTCWKLTLRNRADVKKLLEQIKNLLIVKREQCRLVLEFIDLMDNRPNLSLPKEAYELYEKVKRLNKRGL